MTHINRTLGFSCVGFSLFMLLAYFGLVSFFEFPDILRSDTVYMMNLFVNNQQAIVPFYYIFVLSQLVFIGVVLQFSHYFRDTPSMLLTLATGFGMLAGLCQAIGFLRWPFLVPYLASVVSDPQASAASRETAMVIFQSFHRFAGVGIGENLFFICEGIWSLCFGLYLLKQHKLSPALSSVPILAGIAIMVYSLEQFGGAMQVLGPLNIVAHGALVFWFLGIGKILMTQGHTLNSEQRAGTITTALLWLCYLAIVGPGLAG